MRVSFPWIRDKITCIRPGDLLYDVLMEGIFQGVRTDDRIERIGRVRELDENAHVGNSGVEYNLLQQQDEIE